MGVGSEPGVSIAIASFCGVEGEGEDSRILLLDPPLEGSGRVGVCSSRTHVAEPADGERTLFACMPADWEGRMK